MKLIGRIIIFVAVPVVVGCGLIHVIRNGPNNQLRPQVSVTTGSSRPSPAAPKPAKPTAQPAPPAPKKPVRPVGIDDYKVLSLPMSSALTGWGRQCKGGILIAPDRKLILWARNDQTAYPIASMTKMMTMFTAFEIVEKNPSFSLQTPVRISNSAVRAGGRQVWLTAGNVYPLEKLMQAGMLYSANDCTHAVAEALAPGGELKNFITLMNRRSRSLGMRKALFFNPHGMPEKRDNQATARDMAILALHLRQNPYIRKWVSTVNAKFVHNNGKVISMRNSNYALLQKCEGVTGLKTGYTNNAGSCVTATCERNGELLIAVTAGFKTIKGGMLGKNKRFRFVSNLFDWGYDQLERLDKTGY